MAPWCRPGLPAGRLLATMAAALNPKPTCLLCVLPTDPARPVPPPAHPSGISPIKALIESGTLQVKQRKDVRVYYGVRSKDWVAFADSIPQWEAAGVKVIPVYSEQGGGYVQDAFAKVCGGCMHACMRAVAFSGRQALREMFWVRRVP